MTDERAECPRCGGSGFLTAAKTPNQRRPNRSRPGSRCRIEKGEGGDSRSGALG
jgi:hypothetical protein